MNDIFDIRRLGAFMLKWYKERSILSVLMVWVLLSILVHIQSFFGVFGFYAENHNMLQKLIVEQTNENSQDIGWLFLLIMVMTLKISAKLFSVKTKSYWLLPISKLEKLTFLVVNSLILPIIICTFLYCAVNVANDYKYVYWNTTEISVEEIEKEYGDVVAYKDNLGVEHYKVYPKIKSNGLFMWGSKMSIMNINGSELNLSEDTKMFGVFWTILFVFSLALWMGVSQYNNSTTLAAISHIVLFLVLCASFVYYIYHSAGGETARGTDIDMYSLLESSNIFRLSIGVLFLLPIAYFWIAWKKMSTMQIKSNNIGIVKKYDFLLLALYGFVFALFFVGGYLSKMDW